MSVPMPSFDVKDAVREKDSLQFLQSLWRYAVTNDYRGYDPYDGLNSELFKSTGFYKNPKMRLFWIQLFKHSPMNFRRWAQVMKGFNPKAGALFLLGNLKLYQLTKEDCYRQECHRLIQEIKMTAIQRPTGVSWGYNFDWQARAFYVPQGTPNIVTTVFVGQGLLEYARAFDHNGIHEMLQDIKSFILQEMILWEKADQLCFAYIPGESTEVHNANLLTAAFLSRLYAMNPQERLAEMIHKAVQFSISDIRADGFWPYGLKPHHRWMDNFHTGFNLEALLTIQDNLETDRYAEVIGRVYHYFLNNMFCADGAPKYYDSKVYPIDIHTIAEDMILLSKIVRYSHKPFGDSDKEHARQLANSIFTKAVQKFWNPKGYFYFQEHPWGMNRIAYMRWSQAWMFYALACYEEMKGSGHADGNEMKNRIEFFGSWIDPLTMEETLGKVEKIIRSRSYAQHVVVNVAKLVMMQKDEQLRGIVNSCRLINADGQGIVWGCRLLGKKIPERVAGIDLFLNLVELAGRKDYGIYLLGAKEEVVTEVVRRFRGQYPGLKIVGYRNGYYTDEEEEEIVRNIRDCQPDMLFVAMSSPQKEIFLHKHSQALGVSFVMGVGGSFDIVAGVTRRAPRWMQKMGMEWFYRLLCEPRRLWRRYLVTNGIYLWMICCAKFGVVRR